MIKLCKTYMPILLLASLSFSCGTGNSGEQTASGGIGGTGISQGPITAFGSIFVNGVKFETGEAIVTIDDLPGSDTELKLGMFVTVKGSIDADGITGTALTIDFEADIEGPIDGIDLLSNSLVVMNQTVIVDMFTKFENAGSLADLRENDMVEVSGLLAADGTIQATLIERRSEGFEPDVTEIELKGSIGGLNTSTKTFLIGTQIVNYSGAEFEDMIEAELANGLFVEAKGTRDLSGVLNATEIEKEDGGLGELEAGLEVEIEGLVTDFTSPSAFSVNGQAVITTLLTQFEGGTADDIHLNTRLEVKGKINENSVLVAEEIEFRQNKFMMNADVETTDVSARTVTLLGQTLVLNDLTEMKDESFEEIEDLSLSDIQPGDRLEIKGSVSSGIFIATEVVREDPDLIVEIEGMVDSFAQPQLSVLDITVNTDNDTDFKGKEGDDLSQDAFFALLTSETIVNAKGTFAAGVLMAEALEIEE